MALPWKLTISYFSLLYTVQHILQTSR
ncbi:hypothetical protein GCK32_019199 [Trichostrongylus colubriformis]|uniref:Uncharacterized protein n=1 Tax=Trichostrongylus colubriformis TaxID=6319 RepID=A0AAN8EX52_TRICO